MSMTSTAILAGKILEGMQLATSVVSKLTDMSIEIAKAHSEGRTLSDDELDKHINSTQSAIDALKAL